MYPLVFQHIKSVITSVCERFHLFADETPKTGRPLAINPIDAIVLALYQHQSTRATKKSVWNDFKHLLNCSYKTLVEAINRAAAPVMKPLFILMRLGRKEATLVKFTDATDIPVCLAKNATKHKTMRGLASWGYSGKGFYYGLKMTLTRDDTGRLLGIVLSSANANDRELFRRVNAKIDGIIVADAGYVSKELEREMYVEGTRWCLIKPLKTMRKLIADWRYHLYNKRVQIEFDFRSLKLFHGLVTSLPRSIGGYIANYLHALLSFALA